MEYKGTMLVVKDIEKTKEFYTSFLGMAIVGDMGVNVAFSGGLAAQTEASWMQFTGSQQDQFRYGGHDKELYFEEKDFDSFAAKAKAAGVEIVSESVMPYGQKVLRIYDPDKHIVEVGEDMGVMVRRMFSEGLTKEQVCEKTFMPPEAIDHFMNS
jgi:Lactoylglutathione lyase and related lyases